MKSKINILQTKVRTREFPRATVSSLSLRELSIATAPVRQSKSRTGTCFCNTFFDWCTQPFPNSFECCVWQTNLASLEFLLWQSQIRERCAKRWNEISEDGGWFLLSFLSSRQSLFIVYNYARVLEKVDNMSSRFAIGGLAIWFSLFAHPIVYLHCFLLVCSFFYFLFFYSLNGRVQFVFI